MAKRFKGHYNSRFSQYIDDPTDKLHISRSTSYRRRKRQARNEAFAITAGGIYDLVDPEHCSGGEEPSEVSVSGEASNFRPTSCVSESSESSFSDLDDFADDSASDNSEDLSCADVHQEDVLKNDSMATTTEKDSNDGKPAVFFCIILLKYCS